MLAHQNGGDQAVGFLFKSAIGLGAVYVAMFGQAMKPGAATVSLCAGAAQAQIAGEATLRAQGAALGCAVAVTQVVERAATPPAKAAPAPAETPVAQAGGLTPADLSDPWYGPTRPLKKARRRG